MTCDDLKRLEDLSSENKRLRGDLIRIRNASVISASSCAGGTGKCSSGDPVANMVCTATDVEDQILHNVLEMVEVIDGAPREYLRKIMRQRYVNGHSWGRIARELGYADGAAPYRSLLRFRQKIMSKARENDNGMTTRNGV